MRFCNQSTFQASLIFLLGSSSVIGFVPSRIHRRAESISTLPRIHDAKVWNRNKRTNRPVGFRERPSTLQATAGIIAGMKALHSNSNYVLSLILWLSAFGISLERRTVVTVVEPHVVGTTATTKMPSRPGGDGTSLRYPNLFLGIQLFGTSPRD
mgnify:CR=1 FL=1